MDLSITPLKALRKKSSPRVLSSLFALRPRQRVDYNHFPYSRTGRKSNPVFSRVGNVTWCGGVRFRGCNLITPVGETSQVSDSCRTTDGRRVNHLPKLWVIFHCLYARQVHANIRFPLDQSNLIAKPFGRTKTYFLPASVSTLASGSQDAHRLANQDPSQAVGLVLSSHRLSHAVSQFTFGLACRDQQMKLRNPQRRTPSEVAHDEAGDSEIVLCDAQRFPRL
jgi:hypothetical protein